MSSERSVMERIRSWLADLCFALAGRLDAETYDVWLDDAPRKTHQPGDDEYPDPFKDYATLRAFWDEALLSYQPPDPIPAGGWHRLIPGTDEANRIFAAFVREAFPEHRNEIDDTNNRTTEHRPPGPTAAELGARFWVYYRCGMVGCAVVEPHEHGGGQPMREMTPEEIALRDAS